ncbi:MAG: YbaB/EbfC family nucleoid-associated protein [Bacilli bacterium]|nr:YbaB/EbfC family nucleoid-associated protein [Bacilli bacterium]
MNIQAIMKQAQKMQKEVMKEKEEINKKIFTETYSSVTVSVNGNKEITKIDIDKEMDLSKDDIEMLEDMLMIAINKAFEQVDKETEKRMGKYGQGLSGLM